MTNCRCGIPSTCFEVKKPGPNRGRWYWRCATSTCKFFKWDDSALNFIRHPTEAYAAAAPLANLVRRPPTLPHDYTKGSEHVLPQSHVQITFLLLPGSRIGIRAQRNLTVDPVIARIDDIVWDDARGLWTIPATMRNYEKALAGLPTSIPNIVLEVDPIPDTLIDYILCEPDILANDGDTIGEIELKWTIFLEHPICKRLAQFQVEAVRRAIERRGRILLGNEHGIGIKEPVLALSELYNNGKPVLLSCHEVLCSTWKKDIQDFLGLKDEEVCILDHVTSGLFKPALPRLGKKRKQASTNNTGNASGRRKRRARSNSSSTASSSASTSWKEPTGKARRQQMMKRGYITDSDDSSSEEESEDDIYSQRETDEEDNSSTNSREGVGGSEQEKREPLSVKFYIVSHRKASKNKSKILEQKFDLMICDSSHYLKHTNVNEAKNLCMLLQAHPRAILVSDQGSFMLPIDLYALINAVDKRLYPNLDLYTKRYCNPKSTVFGWALNGRSNVDEFQHILDTKIWYCPSLRDMRSELPNVVRQTIILALNKTPEKKELQEHLAQLQKEDHISDEYIQQHNLLKFTNTAKREPICKYIEYAFETYRRPKIAIAYYEDDTLKAIEKLMTARRMKRIKLDNLQDIQERVDAYNKSNAVQVVLIDMKRDFENENIYLSAVDMVIVVDLPTSRDKLIAVESYFPSHEKETPLIFKYLIAPETIDTYFWPLISQEET